MTPGEKPKVRTIENPDPKERVNTLAKRGKVVTLTDLRTVDNGVVGELSRNFNTKVDEVMPLSEEREKVIGTTIRRALARRFGEATVDLLKLNDSMTLSQVITAIGRFRSFFIEKLTSIFDETDQVVLAKLFVETPWPKEQTPEASIQHQIDSAKLLLSSLISARGSVRSEIYAFLRKKDDPIKRLVPIGTLRNLG